MKLKLHKKLFLGIILLLCINLFIFGSIIVKSKTSILQEIPKNISLEEHAARILALCKSLEYRPGCYDKTIPELMNVLSMEEAFAVTQIVQSKDKTFPYCHVLGHELSASEVKKDPDNWKNVVSRCPSGQCSNGCIHGGFQERFRKESFSTQAEIDNIKPDLKTICEQRKDWNPTGLEQGSCYHALGHLTMYVTEADIDKSLILCNEIALKDDGRDLRQVCYDGVFMQMFQPLEPEDFALIRGKELTKNTVKKFCSDYDPLAQASCISESWPLFSQEVKTPDGLIKHCSQIPDIGLQNRCYSSLFYILTVQFNFDSDKIEMFCKQLPGEIKNMCYANTAARFIETDYRNAQEAISLCQRANTNEAKDACFNELITYSTFNYHPDSNEAKNICQNLPEPWQLHCLQQL